MGESLAVSGRRLLLALMRVCSRSIRVARVATTVRKRVGAVRSKQHHRRLVMKGL